MTCETREAGEAKEGAGDDTLEGLREEEARRQCSHSVIERIRPLAARKRKREGELQHGVKPQRDEGGAAVLSVRGAVEVTRSAVSYGGGISGS